MGQTADFAAGHSILRQPPGHLRDIKDLTTLQEMMNFFYEAVRVPVGILNPVQQWLIQVGWQPICTEFHRRYPLSRQRCLQSDSNIQQHLQSDEHLTFRCPYGLEEVAFPILLDGNRLAIFFMG